MKNKITFFLVLGLTFINLLYNSCKKYEPATISSLFVGQWQLASLTVINTDSLNVKTDTLNTKCDSTQLFTFSNNTCTYKVYSIHVDIKLTYFVFCTMQRN